MAWTIELNSSCVSYEFKKASYDTHDIEFVKSDSYEEDGGYKEPKDSVLINTYKANSEHGEFTWSVKAVRSGFSTLPEIEDISNVTTPKGCEGELPDFSISSN